MRQIFACNRLFQSFYQDVKIPVDLYPDHPSVLNDRVHERIMLFRALAAYAVDSLQVYLDVTYHLWAVRCYSFPKFGDSSITHNTPYTTPQTPSIPL